MEDKLCMYVVPFGGTGFWTGYKGECYLSTNVSLCFLDCRCDLTSCLLLCHNGFSATIGCCGESVQPSQPVESQSREDKKKIWYNTT